MESRAHLSWSKRGFQTALFVIIGCIALSLAVTGVYAVASYAVTSRIREIGVRMALGATNMQIARASLSQTVRLALAGGAAGVLGAVALSRVIRATLYETSPLDGGVFAGTVAVLLAALIIASYIPVRRAIRVNPVETLRNE
jgi:putative ABC transport system permease protein